MSDVWKWIAGAAAALAITGGLIFGGFVVYKTLAPATEQVRREVFEQSMAYNDGMAKELDAMHFEYVQADDEHKAALASVILHRVSGYDFELLPSHIKSFITELRNKRVN